MPRGRSWFVLSGYPGDDIYYEKVIFSCGGQVVNVMRLYPTEQWDLYDPVVERMEDTFKPGTLFLEANRWFALLGEVA
jgi:hypothetical protein